MRPGKTYYLCVHTLGFLVVQGAAKDMDSENTGAISFRDISAVLPHHLDELADVGVGHWSTERPPA